MKNEKKYGKVLGEGSRGVEDGEKGVQKGILEYLERKHIFAWRNNTGTAKFTRANGKKGFIKFGATGSGDILALHKGIFYSIEVKGPDGVVSDNQVLWMERVRANGGVAILARSIDDVINKL